MENRAASNFAGTPVGDRKLKIATLKSEIEVLDGKKAEAQRMLRELEEIETRLLFSDTGPSGGDRAPQAPAEKFRCSLLCLAPVATFIQSIGNILPLVGRVTRQPATAPAALTRGTNGICP
jgi:hypothetical protein